jgi:hypothetical protein
MSLDQEVDISHGLICSCSRHSASTGVGEGQSHDITEGPGKLAGHIESKDISEQSPKKIAKSQNNEPNLPLINKFNLFT